MSIVLESVFVAFPNSQYQQKISPHHRGEILLPLDAAYCDAMALSSSGVINIDVCSIIISAEEVLVLSKRMALICLIHRPRPARKSAVTISISTSLHE